MSKLLELFVGVVGFIVVVIVIGWAMRTCSPAADAIAVGRCQAMRCDVGAPTVVTFPQKSDRWRCECVVLDGGK